MLQVQKLEVSGSVQTDLPMGNSSISHLFHNYWAVSVENLHGTIIWGIFDVDIKGMPNRNLIGSEFRVEL
ncbi:hypothetical protein T11_12358 [Trichinella zimbabwensis]|uniref:Uncharacterized protein n=1 Tax=Trichinella zimbabwensis TaxID=268475 RepID=A0A0V1HIM9_9BILA|nr:hypothetical protein T11_12358 [Trichinella zimbabwensis]